MLFLRLFIPLYPYDSTLLNRIHTAEVAGSNPAVPSEESTSFQVGAGLDHQDEPKAIFQAQPVHSQFPVALFRLIRPP